jgi:ribulose-5-phosphate 4-epimerase/fuculose-1-phosphate aldolase
MNPFGLTYREVRASNLVAVDLDGHRVRPSDATVNAAGFVIHSAFHGSVSDANCVMHMHTTAGVAVASSREGLVDCNFYSAQLHEEVAYHDFEGITLRPDEKDRILSDMGQAHAMILRNHGLLTIGVDAPQAFAYMWTLQRACEVQLAARTLGDVIRVPETISRRASKEAFQFDPRAGAARTMFDALVRAAELRDPSFRT